MRIAHVECPSGVSGDMWLGALIDAGASLEHVRDTVRLLGGGDVRITVGRVRRAGTPATTVRVRPPEGTSAPGSWVDIRTLLEDAGLPDEVRDRSHAVFRRLVTADAAVHGVAPEDVRFHVVAALDTLGDVVGTCAAVLDLGLEHLTVGPVTVGTGAREAHGATPLPEPTVRALLEGFTLTPAHPPSPLVTATGAALIAELCTPVSAAPPLALERTGVGAGDRDLDRPNVLRLRIGEVEPDVLGPLTRGAG